MSKVLPAAKCSQMSNPKAGTGSGGDRCVEATCAMIDATYQLGPKAKAGADPEALMYAFTEEWNNGSDVSALESASRIDSFLAEHSGEGYGVSTVSGTFANVQTIIDRGHIAYTGVNDYRQLRLVDGTNPFQWNPATQPGPAGHVMLIVGYGAGGVIVHDPLRAEDTGQPAEYSVRSFDTAGWQVIGEVLGPRLDGTPEPGSVATTHVIRPGETYWSLADLYYGDPTLYPVIVAANPEENPTALRIGATLVIPPKPVDTSAPAPAPAPAPEAETHIIAAGDTFWGLAERYYGSGALFRLIAQANPQYDATHLPIGAKLVIPPQ